MTSSALPRLAVRSTTAVGLVLGILAILFVLWLPGFWTFLFIGATVSALVALSIGVVYGSAGLVSLCQLSFAAIGAWTVGWLNVNTEIPFLAGLLLGGILAVPVGLAIGLLSLRLRGINLAVVTLSFAVATTVVLRQIEFPGLMSNQRVQRPDPFASENGYFLLSVGVLILISLALNWLRQRPVGLAWTAVRHSERAAAALGLRVPLSKLIAFAVGAFIAGIAGGLLVGQNGTVSLRSFEALDSLIVFAVAVMVGANYLEGAILAGVLGAIFPELFRMWDLPLDLLPILFAIGAIDILRKGGDGIAGQLRRALRAWRAGARARVESTPSVTSATSAASAEESSAAPRRVETEPALEVKGLSVTYAAVKALNNVDITVPAGSVVGLIGPNGAGKSTLVDAATGFIDSYRGSIMVGGRSLEGLPAHVRARGGLRRTFQQGRAVPELTIEQYLRLGSDGTATSEDLDRVIAALDCPGRHVRIDEIDMPTRRLVEAAACLVARPTLLLLDEPAAGLGETESARLAASIATFPELFGCAVLLIEHDVEVVQAACDYVTVLDFGQVIAQGRPEQVLSSPEVMGAFLGTIGTEG
ncbi:lipopolysaccharide export system ATP-binding protein LptB [bacterium BMS3Bbin02]|nr:lipopolysaccharide export system ATP-binding protein LptB [bacterium BMS3Bbin02]